MIYCAYKPKSEFEGEHMSFRLVADSKSPAAMVLGPFWLIWHRQWLLFSIYGVVMFFALALVVTYPGFITLSFYSLPALYLLLEGNEIVRKDLESRGWQYCGIIEADTYEGAQMKFLASAGERVAICADNLPPSRSSRCRLSESRTTEASLPENGIHYTGLFPE